MLLRAATPVFQYGSYNYIFFCVSQLYIARSFSYFETAKVIISILLQGFLQRGVWVLKYSLPYSKVFFVFFPKMTIPHITSFGSEFQKLTGDTEFNPLTSVGFSAAPQIIIYIYIIHTMLILKKTYQKKKVKNNHQYISISLYPSLDGLKYSGYTFIFLLLSTPMRFALKMKNSINCMPQKCPE